MLSALDKQFITLFRAIGRRDGVGMAGAAQALLDRHEKMSPRILRYLAASGMLGYLMQGKQAEAYQLWTQHKAGLFGTQEPDLLFRLLVAESMAPARPGQ